MKALMLALAVLSMPAAAGDTFTLVEPVPAQELWLGSGFVTYHFEREKNLNGNNVGIGTEYKFRSDLSATVGRFYDSDRAYSNYAGAIWQPFAIGPVRLGAVFAIFDGYPRIRGGGWFPAAIPVATVEYRRVGVNIGFVPSFKDRLYGGLSVQIKFELVQ